MTIGETIKNWIGTIKIPYQNGSIIYGKDYSSSADVNSMVLKIARDAAQAEAIIVNQDGEEVKASPQLKKILDKVNNPNWQAL